MTPTRTDHPPPEPKRFKDAAEIDRAIVRLKRCIAQLEKLDVQSAILKKSGDDEVIRSDIKETMREVFGTTSPEFDHFQYVQIFEQPVRFGSWPENAIEGMELGRGSLIRRLGGLIDRLELKRADFTAGVVANPIAAFDVMGLHPQVASTARQLFADGYYWEAVFAGAKVVVSLVKECSGRSDTDGAEMMFKVFGGEQPVLAVNALGDRTDKDEQQGFMHLFAGAVLAARNPGAHRFPEGPPERALALLGLFSLLAFRAQEAKRKDAP